MAVRTALALKPDLAGAHAALAYIYIFADWNFPAAEDELTIVREKDADVVNNLASLRLIQGRRDESTALRREVIRLDPLHFPYYRNLALNLMDAGRWEEAEATTRKGSELLPSGDAIHGLLALIAFERGDPEAAVREAELAPASPGRDLAILMYRSAGRDREQADRALQQLLANEGEQYPVTISVVYAARREPEKMFEWLERAYQRRDPFLVPTLAAHPFYKPYYSDPRYVALCQKIGMPVPK